MPPRNANLPRLILVDGFAGTGKSTLAQHLWLRLVRQGHDAVWFHEHEVRHPIFEYGELEDLLRLSPASFEEQIVARWEAVARDAKTPAIRIIEGSFIQIPAGVMLSMNVPAARIRAFVRRIDAIVAGAGAKLIYLFHRDVRAALMRTGEIRGTQWLDGMAAALSRSRYGQAHRVRNVEGLIEYYRRQRSIVDAVFPRLDVPRLAIDVAEGRWSRYERQAARFLGIRETPVDGDDKASPYKTVAPAELLRHVGSFRGSKTGSKCVVTTDAESLYVQLPRTETLRLVRISDGHFCPESLPIDLRFRYDSNGRARRFEYDSRMVTEVLSDKAWVRV